MADDRSRGREPDPPRREVNEPPAVRRPETPLPRSGRNYALAVIIALIVFLLLVGVRVFWGDMGARRAPATLEETATPPAAPSN
jgi:hypothetical protein